MDDLESFESLGLSIDALPDIDLGFKIPRLAEKPQNPIIESLELWHRRSNKPLPEVEVDVPELIPTKDAFGQEGIEELPQLSLWQNLLAQDHALVNAAMSWDTLRNNGASLVSPFLSERPSYTLAAVRQIVLPTFQDQMDRVFNTTPHELFEYLLISLTGVSSPLHVWNPDTESFFLRGLTEIERGKVLISSLDESTSQSLLQRFLNIGTLMRRLDILTSKLRESIGKSHKHLHAFGHSLSSVMAYLRATLSQISSSASVEEPDMHALTALWSVCADVEAQLQDIASLCGREVNVQPAQYTDFPSRPPEFLSLIYRHLATHFENDSPPTTIAISAFILTSVSADYFERICYAVGYCTKGTLANQQKREEKVSSGLFGDEEEQEIEQGNAEESFSSDERFPCFFTSEFSRSVLRARRSLKLLQAAQPDHPILAGPGTRRRLRWFWSDEEVEAAWLDIGDAHSGLTQASATLADAEAIPSAQGPGYKLEIQAFRLFDLEPGGHLALHTDPSLSPAANLFLSFLSSFPTHLPSLTPTLPTLRDLVFSPLSLHIDTLSAELRDVFLSPSASYLDFQRHLTLLRSYLLLTSHAFKSRLQAAIFCDAPEADAAGMSAKSMAVRARASRSSRKHGIELSSDTWVVGLAPALTEGSSWPPGGSDLSFYLRTVIIDALEADHRSREKDDGDTKEDQLLEEAEWRLGFAIRDLPAGSRARWLNPKSMEALDFLYMDYHPPHPLDVLIPPDVLSRYHRVFAFNLRLMRVENVTKALFRMSLQRHSKQPIFETLTSSRKLFLYFRFVAHAFVTALSSYVYDTAIGGAFDTFLASLSTPLDHHQPTANTLSHSMPPSSTPSDVFALAERHSALLDDILSACLLRGSQKSVGDVLRGVLELILQFGLLMADLHNGKMQEYEAAEPLEELFGAFRRRMVALRKGLKAMIDRTAALGDAASAEDAHFRVLSGTLPGVAARLHDLLTRIEVPETW